MEELEGCGGFQWDEGNADKNWTRHRVSRPECEQIFFNRPLVVHDDRHHSNHEDRFFALGQTDTSRLLFVVFILRGELIRVISARDMTPKERRKYENAAADELEADPEV
ncbi:MAG TPA: BrnT family toxin [Thermoanaerobaculia bacterium]|jgi:hypothetical protein